MFVVDSGVVANWQEQKNSCATVRNNNTVRSPTTVVLELCCLPWWVPARWTESTPPHALNMSHLERGNGLLSKQFFPQLPTSAISSTAKTLNLMEVVNTCSLARAFAVQPGACNLNDSFMLPWSGIRNLLSSYAERKWIYPVWMRTCMRKAQLAKLVSTPQQYRKRMMA